MYIYLNLEIKKAIIKKTYDNNMKRKFLILMNELFNMLVMLLHWNWKKKKKYEKNIPKVVSMN